MLTVGGPRSQEIANWVAAQYGESAPSVDCAIGWEDATGHMTAGVYFDGATDNNVFAHIAATGQIPRALLRAVAIAVYEALGLERMSFLVSEKNDSAVRLVTDMGATREATLKRAFGDADGALYVLWKSDPFARAMLR